MPKVRAYGADATLLAARETSYGVLPLAGWRSLDFKSTDLSSAQPLGEDPLLGRGRNSQDPYRGLITDEGQLEIPLDLRGTGFWLTALFGDPTTTAVAATGMITFSAQPAAASTITINSVAWTFVAGTPTSNQIEIGGTLAATLTNAAAALNASASPQVAAATYGTTGGTALTVTHDTAGPAGNAFTLAASRPRGDRPAHRECSSPSGYGCPRSAGEHSCSAREGLDGAVVIEFGAAAPHLRRARDAHASASRRFLNSARSFLKTTGANRPTARGVRPLV